MVEVYVEFLYAIRLGRRSANGNVGQFCQLAATLPGECNDGHVQGVGDTLGVTLIRHAYVRTARRNEGIGSKLLSHLRQQTTRPILIGTWADATWAIRFYEKHGFIPLELLEGQSDARPQPTSMFLAIRAIKRALSPSR